MHPCVSGDDKKNNLKVNKTDGFSKLYNFTYDDKGLRVWRAYDIGPGKLISFDDVVVGGENGLSVFPQLIQCKRMVVQGAVAFAAQKKRQIRRLQI